MMSFSLVAEKLSEVTVVRLLNLSRVGGRTKSWCLAFDRILYIPVYGYGVESARDLVASEIGTPTCIHNAMLD